MLEELASLPERKCRTRQFYNQQRHVDRLSRELAAEGFTSLPQELLYRTHARWREGTAVLPEHANAGKLIERAGLAYLQPKPVIAWPVEPCVLIGLPILHRPIERFLGQHKADHFSTLMRDLGLPSRPALLGAVKRLAQLLSERLALEPLALTSGWSDMVETTNVDGRLECTIRARYSGQPTLWPIGPGAGQLEEPLRAILNDEFVTLKARLPVSGRSSPQATLAQAAARLEHSLGRMTVLIAAFNASLDAEALRRVHYDLVHKRKDVTISLVPHHSVRP